MRNDFAITISDVTKSYKLYTSHKNRVIETFNPFGRKYHHPFNALSNVSYKIRKGETIGIIGRNGSGKSTLLQIICGIIQPTSGQIDVNGKISALLELGAGFNPEFTGRENTYINSAIMGLKPEEIDACFDDITNFAGIGEYIDQPVKTYSSGMYVRLAFAIAVNVKPDILVVDEALSVGDTQFQAKCFAKFKEFQDNNVTILFVTHALDLVTRYCTSAFLLEGGAVYASGNPKTVVDDYNRLMVGSSKKSSTNNTIDKRKTDDIKGGLQWSRLFAVNPEENRYGNGKAEILEAGLFTMDGEHIQKLMLSETYSFKMKVKFNETIHEPVFGYTIKDVKGFDISGSNTLYKEVDTGTIEKGEIVLVSFAQKMLLSPGGYLISFGCAGFEEDKYVVYERRYDFMTFEVVSKQGTVGIFDMDSKISTRKLTL